MSSSPRARADAFCARYGLRVPLLLAPMSGARAPTLPIAVARAGGMGALGALQCTPQEIAAWTEHVRGETAGPFQLNTWIPDPVPRRDADAEARIRTFARPRACSSDYAACVRRVRRANATNATSAAADASGSGAGITASAPKSPCCTRLLSPVAGSTRSTYACGLAPTP